MTDTRFVSSLERVLSSIRLMRTIDLVSETSPGLRELLELADEESLLQDGGWKGIYTF